MKTAMKTAESIRQRIKEIPVGEPFTPALFLQYGTRAAVGQMLYRLVKSGEIIRAARGIFVCPTMNRFVGNVMPQPIKIAKAIAKATGAIVDVHGAEATRLLGLSTQASVQPIFTTSGISRIIRYGNMNIRLQHVSQRKLALAGREAGLALAAMWYLGKHELTSAHISRIQHKLPSAEFEVLRSATGVMPAWMSDVMYRYEREVNHHA
jgi:hypothetical protein